MAPTNTTQPIIQGSVVVGNEIVLPTPIKSKNQIRRKIIGNYVKLEYQWFSNGVRIADAKTSSYTPHEYEKNVTCSVKYRLPRHRRQYRVRRWVLGEKFVFWDNTNGILSCKQNYY
jgi:hypothetical protein